MPDYLTAHRLMHPNCNTHEQMLRPLYNCSIHPGQVILLQGFETKVVETAKKEEKRELKLRKQGK
jgi:hypothetical protein